VRLKVQWPRSSLKRPLYWKRNRRKCTYVSTVVSMFSVFICATRLCHTWRSILFPFPNFPVPHFSVSHFQRPQPANLSNLHELHLLFVYRGDSCCCMSATYGTSNDWSSCSACTVDESSTRRRLLGALMNALLSAFRRTRNKLARR